MALWSFTAAMLSSSLVMLNCASCSRGNVYKYNKYMPNPNPPNRGYVYKWNAEPYHLSDSIYDETLTNATREVFVQTLGARYGGERANWPATRTLTTFWTYSPDAYENHHYAAREVASLLAQHAAKLTKGPVSNLSYEFSEFFDTSDSPQDNGFVVSMRWAGHESDTRST